MTVLSAHNVMDLLPFQGTYKVGEIAWERKVVINVTHGGEYEVGGWEERKINYVTPKEGWKERKRDED